MNSLSELGNTPVDIALLKQVFQEYKSVNNKISLLEKDGTLIRLKKGVYVTSPKVSGQLLSLELIANHIYGPSYVSMESALRYYGLIPESVQIMRSITIKHTKSFNNPLGTFEYIRSSKEYFQIGISQKRNKNTSFLIASPEKALCDLIVNTSNLNLRYQKELLTYLEEDLRFDMNAFYLMNISVFEKCLPHSKKKTTISNLIKLIKNE